MSSVFSITNGANAQGYSWIVGPWASSVGTEGVRLGGEGPGASASYCCYDTVDDINPALPIYNKEYTRTPIV